MAKVVWGWVPLVLGESVPGVAFVERVHDLIAGDLGENAGTGDGIAEGVPLRNSGLARGKRADWQSIDEEVIGGRVELCDGAKHGGMGGGEDVELVDFLGLGESDGELEAWCLVNGIEESLSSGRGELFGIVELLELLWSSASLPMGGEDECGGDDGTCERAASGLVNACDPEALSLPMGSFEGKPICCRRGGHGSGGREAEAGELVPRKGNAIVEGEASRAVP